MGHGVSRGFGSAAVVVALLFIGLSAGCQRSPRAPLLRDEPIYQNSQAGFRFQVPQGWTQIAKGEWPAKAPQERMLVEYKSEASEQPAGFQVLVVDLPASTNLEKYLAKVSFGTADWRPAGAESLKIGSIEGERHIFESGSGKEKRPERSSPYGETNESSFSPEFSPPRTLTYGIKSTPQ